MLMLEHNLSTTPFIIQIFINAHNFSFFCCFLFLFCFLLFLYSFYSLLFISFTEYIQYCTQDNFFLHLKIFSVFYFNFHLRNISNAHINGYFVALYSGIITASSVLFILFTILYIFTVSLILFLFIYINISAHWGLLFV